MIAPRRGWSPPDRVFTSDEIAAMVEATRAVERLSDVSSRFGDDRDKTQRGTAFVTVYNGMIKPECEAPEMVATVEEACAKMVATAVKMRSRIKGPAVLWWRTKPYLEWANFGGRWSNHRPPRLIGATHQIGVYARFCFEGGPP